MVVGQFAVTLEVAFSHPCKYFNTQVYSIYYMLASSYFLGWMTNISLWRWRRVVEQLPPDCCDNNSSEFEIWHFICFDSLHCIFFLKKTSLNLYELYMLYTYQGVMISPSTAALHQMNVWLNFTPLAANVQQRMYCAQLTFLERQTENMTGELLTESFFFFKVKPQKVDTWRKVK